MLQLLYINKIKTFKYNWRQDMNGVNEKDIGKRIEFIRKKEKLSRREFGKIVK